MKLEFFRQYGSKVTLFLCVKPKTIFIVLFHFCQFVEKFWKCSCFFLENSNQSINLKPKILYSIWFYACRLLYQPALVNHSCTALKVSKNGVISGPYFPAFGLNTKIYGVNLRIQSEYRKIRTRNKSVFGRFSRSDHINEYLNKSL